MKKITIILGFICLSLLSYGQIESDNVIKYKGDLSGDYDAATLVPKGYVDLASAQIIEITYTNLMAAISGSDLIPGMFYKITDRGDRWLLFQAVSTNQLATDGQRLMLCAADYAIETDSYGNNWIGVWNDTKSVVADDLTIWGGLAWKNLTGAIGTASDNITLDATNWEVIPKASFTNNEYTEMLFGVQYDWVNDYAVKQWDNKGNIITNFGFAYNTCDCTDWNYETSGAKFSNNICFGCYNNISSEITFNLVGEVICDNIVPDGIYNNNVISVSNNIVTEIYDNANNGVINLNNFVGSIYNNINNGNIASVSAAVHINVYSNINNGYITGAQIADVTDPIVNK
jgi:hypothetical protein